MKTKKNQEYLQIKSAKGQSVVDNYGEAAILKAMDNKSIRSSNAAFEKFCHIVTEDDKLSHSGFLTKREDDYAHLIIGDNKQLTFVEMPSIILYDKLFAFRFVPYKTDIVLLTKFWTANNNNPRDYQPLVFNSVMNFLSILCNYHNIKLSHDNDDSFSDLFLSNPNFN